MSRSPLDVVCDAGPLIHLDEMGCLDLLIDFHAVLVPEQVWREVEYHPLLQEIIAQVESKMGSQEG